MGGTYCGCLLDSLLENREGAECRYGKYDRTSGKNDLCLHSTAPRCKRVPIVCTSVSTACSAIRTSGWMFAGALFSRADRPVAGITTLIRVDISFNRCYAENQLFCRRARSVRSWPWIDCQRETTERVTPNKQHNDETCCLTQSMCNKNTSVHVHVITALETTPYRLPE